MKQFFVRSLAVIMIVALVIGTTGCFGSFTLTKKVYEFNKGMGDKWINEVVFLVMNIVPVYGAAAFVDAVVLNSLEFWTGSNPLASNETFVIREGDVIITYHSAPKMMEVNVPKGEGRATYFIAIEEGNTVVRDADMNLIATVATAADGSISLSGENGALMAIYSSAEVQSVIHK